MIPSQMLKGTLEGCILSVIGRKETYGYEISQELEKYGFGRIAEGTVYPLLLRLEKNGLVTAELRSSGLGPKRKYYRLTGSGKEELYRFIESFAELSRAVNNLLEESEDEQANESASQGE